MIKNRLWICVLLSLLFFGCALWPKESIKENSRTKGEKQFDPLGFPQDQVIITEKEPKEKREGASEFEKQSKTGWEQSTKAESLLPREVYRVQFFATKYPDEASQVAEAVENQLSQKAYIHYKTPYYWVRVGDCETKEEADSLLEKIKKLGYKESWVVEMEIKP